MIMRNLFVFSCLMAVVAGPRAFGQTPPANDNFTNAILLSGYQVTFSGTLTNSTAEAGEPAIEYNFYSSPRSVWWKWAPAT
jgi:hypothetical protein